MKLLVKNKYLSKGLSKKVISMVGLRNILVHEYVAVDDEKLYHFLEYLNDFIAFVQEIRENL